MRYGNHAKLVRADLVDDAIGKPAEQIAPPCTSEYGPNLWIGQNSVHSMLELREER
jgi:hypothetical protein